MFLLKPREGRCPQNKSVYLINDKPKYSKYRKKKETKCFYICHRDFAITYKPDDYQNETIKQTNQCVFYSVSQRYCVVLFHSFIYLSIYLFLSFLPAGRNPYFLNVFICRTIIFAIKLRRLIKENIENMKSKWKSI